MVGISTGDDAAVYKLDDDTAIIQTLDFFPPIVDDPYLYGQIAAANALSDVYAMGGRPLLALNIVGFPIDLPKEILGEILRGGGAKAQEAGVLIVGGHTVDDQEPKYGLSVTGLVTPGAEMTNAGARPGDALVLTKPIGTGIITTAGKQQRVPDDVLANAVSEMATLNRAAAEAMTAAGANACADVTGFGLLGHLRAICQGSGVGARVHFGMVPQIDGAWELLESGVAPGGTHRNLASIDDVVEWNDLNENQRLLLVDAQTSGGLLISIAPDRLDGLLAALEDAGVQTRAVVGEIVAKEDLPEGILIEALP